MTDLLAWTPTADECTWILETLGGSDWFTCVHPDGSRGTDLLQGGGRTPTEAYNDFLGKLGDWQQEQADKRERQLIADEEYECADSKRGD